VLAIDSAGQPVFSPVILFMDRDASATREYYKISTESGKTITMTGSHLIFVMDDLEQDFNSTVSNKRVLFARQVIPKQFVLSAQKDGAMSVERVADVRVEKLRGAFAPLTREGNLVVNDVLASCYANIRHQWLAHASFFPVRSYSNLIDSWNHLFPKRRRRRRDEAPEAGIHWYPRMLQSIAARLLPANYFD
jgi:hedgehog protein